MALLASDSVIQYGGSDFGEVETDFLKAILRQIDADIEQAIRTLQVPRGVVRSVSPCLTYMLMNSTDIYVIAKKTDVIASNVFTTVSEGRHSADAIQAFAVMTMGLDNPFAFQLDRSAIEQSPLRLHDKISFAQLATDYVRGEFARMKGSNNLISISPVFGPLEYEVHQDLCFVIGPFAPEPTSTYSSIIKPAIESVGLICRRADEMFTNRAIMNDIWKSICEARIIVADLSGGNPNVFYELGVAHTLGKETILLSSDDGERIPFDIQGIRQIRFQNTPAGGTALSTALIKTLHSLLSPDIATGNAAS